METWQIGLSAWIIQDGNYPDFKKGQLAEFALNFGTNDKIGTTVEYRLEVKPVGECEYQVTGRVVYANPECWIIDFGLLAYADNPLPPAIKVGTWVSAKIWLEIDYYLYFESLSRHKGIPSLIYTWRIQKILQQTAPFVKQISTQPGFLFGKEVSVRDPAKIGYKQIEVTDAWHDDGGFAEYILVCEKLDAPVKRTSATVT